MTDEELKAIEARCEAATAGPWKAGRERDEVGLIVHAHTYLSETVLAPADASYRPQADSAFIAHARQDIPTLLAEVRRLQAEVHRLSALFGANPPPPGFTNGLDKCSLEQALCWADEQTIARPKDEQVWPEEVLAAEVRRLQAEVSMVQEVAGVSKEMLEFCYSTAAVDALLSVWDRYENGTDWRVDEDTWQAALAAVRASREPKP